MGFVAPPISTKGKLNDHKLDASRTIDGIDANNDSSNRLSQLKQFYFNSYNEMEVVAYESYADLDASQCYHVLEALAALLHKYKGPSTDVAFEKWAKRTVVKEASRYKLLALATTEYASLIHKAIHENLWTTAMDCGVGHDDIFNEVLWLIFQKAPALSKKGTAKLSTRLYALTKKHVYLYHNSRNKKRLAAVTRRIEKDGDFSVEVLSDAELAAMKKDAAGYDPGYREAGLSLA
jgi:hypothetical protein